MLFLDHTFFVSTVLLMRLDSIAFCLKGAQLVLYVSVRRRPMYVVKPVLKTRRPYHRRTLISMKKKRGKPYELRPFVSAHKTHAILVTGSPFLHAPEKRRERHISCCCDFRGVFFLKKTKGEAETIGCSSFDFSFSYPGCV
jgi:hypothetical protein